MNKFGGDTGKDADYNDKVYEVVMTRTVIVTAESEEQAQEKAFDLYKEDMDSREVIVYKL